MDMMHNPNMMPPPMPTPPLIPDVMDLVRAHIDCRPIDPSPSTPFGERHLPTNQMFQMEIAPMLGSMRDHDCGKPGCPGHRNSWDKCFEPLNLAPAFKPVELKPLETLSLRSELLTPLPVLGLTRTHKCGKLFCPGHAYSWEECL